MVDLYNEYACPWQQWGLALEMVEIANYTDTGYVRQLWDVYLRQVKYLLLTLFLTNCLRAHRHTSNRKSFESLTPFPKLVLNILVICTAERM